MTETSARPTSVSRFLSRLARTRAVTRASIIVERFWPLALPLVIVACLFVSLSWLAVFRVMPDWLRFAVLGILLIAGLASLWPFRYFRRPTSAEIDRRIERANRLEHAPVLTQTDRLSAGTDDPFAAALWREHQKRMADRLGRLSGDLPRTKIPERDPWGLRALAALLLVTAFAFSLGPDGGRLTDAFRAGGGRPAVPPRIDAWVTPPTYTGKAPIFLTADANAGTNAFTVPTGSAVAVRVTGGSGEETLSLVDGSGNETGIEPGDGKTGDAPKSGSPAKSSARQFSTKLTQDGSLNLRSGGGQLRAWSFSVVPDKAPAIRFAGEPKRAVNGTLELAYEIDDDYGAAKAVADFKLAEPATDARPLYDAPELPLSLPRRGGKDKAAKTSKDLSAHPWAGSTVDLMLEATDDAGQTGKSEAKTIVLPQRPFSNPLARALIEDRRLLALDANKKMRVLEMLDAVALWPEETSESMAHYLAIASARSRLDIAGTDDQLRGVVDYLWDIALNIENGDLTEAEKRLRQARQALRDALKNGASDEEIDKLMQNLRQAMNDYLREFAERAQQNPNLAQQAPENSQTMSKRDIDRMLDQIQELAKSGSKDKAEQLLSQLENMMNNMQAGRSQKQGQQSQQQSEMRQQMDKLGELMRRQQQMMDETFSMNQMQRGQQQRGQQGQQRQGEQGQQSGQGQPQNQPMTPEEFAEAMRRLQEGQGQLQKDLQGMTKGMEGLGMKPGKGFGEAGQAMGEAEGALGNKDGQGAVGEQGRALEALRQGARDMMNQMRQARRGQQGGSEEGGRQQNADRDPLGRPRASNGPDFGDSVKVPDEIDIQRARRILEAIRRRLGNALSPELEKKYLERLLDIQ